MTVRSASIVLTANASQAIAESKRLGDELEKTAARGERAGERQGKAWETAGKIGGRVAVAGAAGLAVMTKANVDFDKAMSGVSAATMAGERDLDRYRTAAIKAGADTQYSATEAAGGITELAKAGITAEQILGGGLDGALSLAAAGQIGVAEAAETAASALTQFNLEGKDVPRVADLLAAGAGKAQGSVKDLSMALGQSGLISAQTGLSVEETVGALTSFASAGLLGSDAGTSFKTMLMSLNPRSGEAAELMKRYNIEAYDAQGNFVGLAQYAEKLKDGLSGLTTEQRNAALQTIFGSDAIRAAQILYRQGGQGIDSWTKKVADQGYAAEVAARQTENLAGDWERLTGSLESAFITSGSGAQDGLRDILQGVESIVDAFAGLPVGVQENAVKAVGILTAAGGLLWTVNKIRGGLETVGVLGGTKTLGKGVPAAAGGALGKAAKGPVPVFVTNPGFGADGAAGGKAGASRGAAAAAGGAAGAASRFTFGGAAATAGAAVATGLLVKETVDLGQQWIRTAKAGDDLKLTQDGLTTSLEKSNVGEHAKEMGINLNQLAADLEKNGKNGEYVKSVYKGLEEETRRWNTANRLLGVVNPFGDTSALRANSALMDLDKITEATGRVRNSQSLANASWQTGIGIVGQLNPAMGKYGAVLKTIPKHIRSYVSNPGAAMTMASMQRLARQYNLTPKQVRTTMLVQGFSETQARIAAAGKSYRALPKDVRTALRADTVKTMADVRRLQRQYDLTPPEKRTVMQVSGVAQSLRELASLRASIDAVRSKSVTIETIIRRRVSGNNNIAVPSAEGSTVPKTGLGYADRHLYMLADGEEITSNRRGQADRYRPVLKAINADMPAASIKAMLADGGTAGYLRGLAAGGTARADLPGGVTITFPAPAVMTASVKAADAVAAAAAKTTRSYREQQDYNLEVLRARQQIVSIERSLAETEIVKLAAKPKAGTRDKGDGKGRDRGQGRARDRQRDRDDEREERRDRTARIARSARDEDRADRDREGRRKKRDRDGKRRDDNAKNAAQKRRLVLTGIDRQVATAELGVARRNLADLLSGYTAAEEARKALTETRAATATSLRDRADIFARGASGASAVSSVQRMTADIAAYGQVVARLKAAKASPALLAQVIRRGSEEGDFRSATRLGQALLNQPALLGQLNAALGVRDAVTANVAALTTDPRLMSASAWNPTATSTVVRRVQVNVSPDHASYAALRSQITHDVVAAIAG